MAYQRCGACNQTHRDIDEKEVRTLLNAYVAGEAQVVTNGGVMHRCILDIIGRPNNRNERRTERGLALVGPGYLLS